MATPPVVRALAVRREGPRKVRLAKDGDAVEQARIPQLVDERADRIVHLVEVGVERLGEVLVRVEAPERNLQSVCARSRLQPYVCESAAVRMFARHSNYSVR